MCRPVHIPTQLTQKHLSVWSHGQPPLVSLSTVCSIHCSKSVWLPSSQVRNQKQFFCWHLRYPSRLSPRSKFRASAQRLYHPFLQAHTSPPSYLHTFFMYFQHVCSTRHIAGDQHPKIPYIFSIISANQENLEAGRKAQRLYMSCIPCRCHHAPGSQMCTSLPDSKCSQTEEVVWSC